MAREKKSILPSGIYMNQDGSVTVTERNEIVFDEPDKVSLEDYKKNKEQYKKQFEQEDKKTEVQQQEEKQSQVQQDVVQPQEQPKEVQKQQAPSLDSFSKAVTDMYQGSNISDIFEAGWILDGKGKPIKSDNPAENMQTLYELFKNKKDDEELYFTNVPKAGKDGADGTETLSFDKDKGQYEAKPYPINVINSDLKDATIERLMGFREGIMKYNGGNENLKSLRDNCNDIIDELEGTVDKGEFDKRLNDFTKDAKEYYQKHAPISLNKKQEKNTSLCYDLLKLDDDVSAGHMPSTPDKVEEIQSRIAAKYVGAYCMHVVKGEGDPRAIQEAQETLDDPERFADKVNKTLKDPAFLYLYGSRKEGDEKDMLSRLSEGLSSKAAKVFKNVEAEQRYPSETRLQIQAAEKAPPKKRIEEHKKYESMSLQDQKPVAEMVKTLKEELEAIGGNNNSSPEFEKLRKELLIADIRLQRGNSYMDVKGQMAELGDAVDEYLSKKTQESSLGGKGLKRASVAMRIRDLCDGVAQNKKPAEAVKSPSEAQKELLAERLTSHISNVMLKTDDPLIAKEGLAMKTNKEAIKKAKQQLLNSDSFKELFNTPDKITAALNQKPANVYDKICKHEAKTAPEAVKKAQKQKSQIKDFVNKAKEKVDDMTENGNTLHLSSVTL